MADVEPLEACTRDDGAVVGGKAANLGELIRAGFAVPPGFVVTTAAYTDFVAEHRLADEVSRLAGQGPAAATQIRALVTAHPLPEPLTGRIAAGYLRLGAGAVAVRSSATAEDLPGASFAGQQDTELNVVGREDLLAAVRACWASLWTERAMTYRAQQGVPATGLSLAVVVQQMVPADLAGVMFTANPLHGRTDEVVISAAPGLGEGVVNGAVATDEVVVDPAGPRIVSRRNAGVVAVLSDVSAYELAALGVQVAAHFGAPQDIEWAIAAGELFLLQSRPITVSAPPEAPPPTAWGVPDPSRLYVRASIVEQLPDPLTPLFADLIDPAVTRSLTALMTELVGAGAVRPGDVSLPTVNGYAYYAYTRSGALRITLRSVRAVAVLGNGPRSGRERRRRYARPRYGEAVARWTSREPATASGAELLVGVRTLLDAGAEYYTSVQTIIPVAAMSEVLFTRFYDTLVRRPADPPAATFLLGFDSLPIRAEKSLHDLAGWVRDRPEVAQVLRQRSSAQLLADRDAGHRGSADSDRSAFWARLQDHLDRFGHTVYNLDFVNPVPADDPAPVLDALRCYLSHDTAGPYERQQRSVAAREAATRAVRDRLDPVRRRGFDRLLRWAQDSAPLREDALADVGLAWPQLRRMLAELGRRLVVARVIDSPPDVYWLRWSELDAAISTQETQPRGAEVERRRQLWRGRRRVSPPQILPERGWGSIFRRYLPATSQDQTGKVLTGLAGSAGRVTAVARVVSGPEDFGRLQVGEVLVANITTPAWTSLFTRAAAVVTDVGGPLSHSSIVAREYGIPAVLGTAVATRRIRSGQRVTVDGDAGTVTLIDPDPPV